MPNLSGPPNNQPLVDSSSLADQIWARWFLDVWRYITGPIQVNAKPSGNGFPNLTGLIEANFADSDMASGNYNAGIVVNAVASNSTARGVNGLWVKAENRLDSAIGVTSVGAMFNGVLIDTEPNLTSGAPQASFTASEFDETNYHIYSTGFLGLSNTGSGTAGSLAPTLYFLKHTGITRMGGGWLWLSKNGTGARNSVVAAPTGVVSAVTAGTGTLAAGHYRFMVSAYNDVGEGLPSTATTDLTITSGQVISITWNRVAGARAYRIYAAYSASGDPGTALASYFAQNAQTASTLLSYMIDRDILGTGVGTQTGYLSNELATGTLGINMINDNPLTVDRSAFYYLRMSDITNNTRNPAFDKFNLDTDGFVNQRLGSVASDGYLMTIPASAGLLTSFLRVNDGSNNYFKLYKGASSGGGIDLGTGVSRAEITLKAAGGGADGLLYGAVGAATGSGPKFIAGSGSVTIQGYDFTFSSIEGTNTGLNNWVSAVDDTHAASVGAFGLNSSNAISAGNKLILAQNNSAEKFSVYGNGDVVSQGAIAQQTANGALWTKGSASELLTLSTSGTTTDTSANLLPANSIIEAVVARVTTTITTATDWKLGDATIAGRFSGVNAVMTAGTTQVGTVQADQTGTSGPRQVSAAKVRVTTTGTPGAGAIRITVFYRTFTPPSS